MTIWVVVVVLAFNPVTQALTVDWVTVGNAGNGTDPAMGNLYGAVGYAYRISTYEVTAGQYTDFLNAVATTDTHGLYNASMDSSSYGCQITQNGTSGNYTYDFSGGAVEVPGSTASDWSNRPVNYVSWYDTLRFCNWLHNGQGAGDTEDGAYDMSLGSSVVRKAGAQVFLPTENEWYKAAYHKNDGVTGNYFDYPTSSDSTPSNDLVNPDPGNNATFRASGDTIGSPYYRTEVGAHENSDSPYGTFDMGGNVWEWNESLISSVSARGLRGGSYINFGALVLVSSTRAYGVPYYEYYDIGFRVASVPLEPVMINLDIKPQSCPNPLNVKSKGVLPVAILGSDVFDVGEIDIASIRLERVAPAKSAYEDVASPVLDQTGCSCTTDGPDGYMDLTLKFKTQEIMAVLGEVHDGEIWLLYLTGLLYDGTEIEGSDCMQIIKKGK